MSFLNSRKVSWIIFGITLLTAVVSLFFLPDIIPVHFGILGTPDTGFPQGLVSEQYPK